MDCWHLVLILTQGVHHWASSTYSAFHSRSPTLAVTGPVEIHAFSTWNWLFLTNQINRNLVHNFLSAEAFNRVKENKLSTTPHQSVFPWVKHYIASYFESQAKSLDLCSPNWQIMMQKNEFLA
jgi:hypothetical protein